MSREAPDPGFRRAGWRTWGGKPSALEAAVQALAAHHATWRHAVLFFEGAPGHRGGHAGGDLFAFPLRERRDHGVKKEAPARSCRAHEANWAETRQPAQESPA